MDLPKKYLRKMWRTVVEFDMIHQNDKVVVGLSGGKDSMFLLYALKIMQRKSPFKFSLAAITVDLGFGNMEESYLKEYCDRLEVPLFFEKTKISDVVMQSETVNPCAKCAFLRRGALIRIAKQEGYNLLALAHHQDDAVETFLLSLLYSGQLKTFMPMSILDKNDIKLIRPLAYFTEAEVVDGLRFTLAKPVKNPCPYSGKTKREKVKTILNDLIKENANVYTHLLSAMRDGKKIELWPCRKSQEEMQLLYKNYLAETNNEEF